MNPRYALKAAFCVLILLATQLPGAGPEKKPEKKSSSKSAPAGRRTVSDTEVTTLERDAMKCRAASEALDMYREFVAVTELTAAQATKVRDRQKVWQDRVDRQLVRLGTEWVTRDQAKATAQKADELIEQAFEKIKAGEFKAAKEALDKATKADPSGIRADYYLGMLNSPNLWNYAAGAEKSFERAHKRDPENPGICNNLALSKLKMGRWSDALDLWAEGLRTAPEAPEIVHNLGRFVKEASAKRIKVGDPHTKRAKRVYEKSLADKKGPPTSATTGWMYSRLALSAAERERTTLPAQADDENNDAAKPGASANKPKKALNLVGWGTGFFVSPGYVLSNKHVAQGGTSYGVVHPGAEAKEFDATVVSVADDLDLALFKCDAPEMPAVTLNAEAPKRSSEILVLGFPFGEMLGASVKSLRGSVFGFDDDVKRQMMMYEATTNPGNSGGPVCDNTGRVIAVHFAGLDLTKLQRGTGKLGAGIPIEAAMPFLKGTLPDLATGEAGGTLDWPAIDERVSKSVVLMKLYSDTLPMPTAKGQAAQDPNVFEDCTCTACKGRSKIPCPVQGCFKGSVADFEMSYSVNGVGRGAQVLQWPTPRNRACTGCRGAGVIDCPHCTTGLDPGLK
jgi:S1-C subfamily serine protease